MDSSASRRIKVRDTELVASDTRQQYREKIARITLDSMVQFVGLLDAQGTVLEINKVALDAVGITLADVEGKPFWTTFWWQVSEEINATLRESIARAAQGEFVRWDTPIYGRAGGKETIIIDASLCPVMDDARQRRVHRRRRTRHHREEGAGARDRRRRTSSCRACSSASASSTRSRPSSSPTSATSCARRWR